MIRFKKDDGSNYPEIKIMKIKDICTVTNGKGNTQDKIDDGIYPFYVRSDTVERSNKYIFDNEAIITSGDGVGVGKIFHYVNGKYNLHQRCYACFDFKDVNCKYFYYYFSTFFYRRVKRLSAKGSVDSVRLDFITEMDIKVPCLEEQQKIADFLSSVDDIITASEQEVAALEEQKKGAMQKIFSQEVRFKADDGSDYPEWEEKSVKELTLFHKQGYYTKEEYVENGIKLARVSDLFNPKVDFESMPMIDISERDYEAFKVSVGDFLIARSGSIGRYGIVTEIPEDIKVVFGSFVIKFNFDENLLSTKYFGEFYSSDFALRQLKRIIQAGANVNINAENIKTIKVPLPCIEEQQKIADFLSDFDTAIDLAKQELEQWKELKKGLLQQLFE